MASGVWCRLKKGSKNGLPELVNPARTGLRFCLDSQQYEHESLQSALSLPPLTSTMTSHVETAIGRQILREVLDAVANRATDSAIDEIHLRTLRRTALVRRRSDCLLRSLPPSCRRLSAHRLPGANLA
jgi:hypothetical protein